MTMPDQLRPLSFRTISLGLRPARHALLLPADDMDWMDTSFRAIEWLSSIWGGSYGLLVPMANGKLDRTFWRLLELYDPDYVFAYRKTMVDVKTARPQDYARWVDANMAQVLTQAPGEDPASARGDIEGQADMVRLSGRISEEFARSLVRRLNPFHAVGENLEEVACASAGGPWFLTSLPRILPNAPDFFGLLDIELDAGKDIRLLFHAIAGRLSPSYKKTCQDRHVVLHTANVPGDLLPQALELIWLEKIDSEALNLERQVLTRLGGQPGTDLPEPLRGDSFRRLPYPVTRVQCSLFYDPRERRLLDPTAVIVLGDTQADFCLYYCLSRLRPRVYWIPERLLAPYQKAQTQGNPGGSIPTGEEEIPMWLAAAIRKALRTDERPKVVLTSLSLKAEDLKQMAVLFEAGRLLGKALGSGMGLVVTSDLDDLLRYPLRLYERNNAETTYTEQFHGNESVNPLATPTPKTFTEVPPEGHYWITDVRVEGYALPARAALGPQTLRQHNYGTEEVRVTREGFAYFCPQLGYFPGWGDLDQIVAKPRLHLLDPLEIFSQTYGDAGYSIRLSDKGKYQAECARLVGGFDKLANFLKDQHRVRVLDKYLDSSPSQEGDGVYLGPAKRRYLDLPAVAKLVGSQATAASLIDDLVQIGVLERGLILQCDRCQNAAWYPLADLSRTFTCGRCRAEQPISRTHWKMPDEPRWYYELSEVMYQGYQHGMVVPVLTVAFLKSKAKGSVIFLPEVELRRDRVQDKPDTEIDLSVVLDGRLYVGECTREDRVDESADGERRRLERLRDMAASLDARGVVLSTVAGAWREPTSRIAAEVFGVTELHLWLLTEGDLKPRN